MSEQRITIYAAGMTLQAMFKEVGVERKGLPNYLYNYNAKGKLPVTPIDNTVTFEEVKVLFEWMSGKSSRGRRVNHAAVAKQLLSES